MACTRAIGIARPSATSSGLNDCGGGMRSAHGSPAAIRGTAVCTVLVGGALIIPHIGRPQLLYELVTQPNLSAPVFWDFIAVTTYTFASVVFFALPLIPVFDP